MIIRTRPSYYPLHDELGTNSTAPESSLYVQSGYPTGLPVPSSDHNGKLNSNGRWSAYADANQLHIADWIDTTANATLTRTTHLEYVNGGNVLTTGAVVDTRGAYLIQGARFETDDAFLNPIGASIAGSPLVYPTATVPGRIWVYANEDGDVRYDSVGPAVADSPASDEITLVGLQVDALGVVTDGAVAPITLPLPAYSLPIAIPIAGVQASFTTLTAIRATLTGAVGFPTLQATAPAGQIGAVFTGNGTQVAVDIPTTTGPALTATTSGGSPAITGTSSGTKAGVFAVSTGSGPALTADSTGGSSYAIDATGPVGGTVINSSTASGIAVLGTAATTGVGIGGLGGSNSTSLAVRGESTHVDAYAIQGITANGASATTAGVLGSGRGAGAGVYANATGTGYGLIAAADTTTPARSALRMIPQDADPTTPLQGDLLFNSARGATGKNRTYTTQWESVHSSPRGLIDGWAEAADGSGVNSGDLATVQLTPEQVGTVLIEATGAFSMPNATDTFSILLRDTTAGTTIRTVLVAQSIAGELVTQTVRAVYTLPSTVTRDFNFRVNGSGGNVVTREACVLSVRGVQA